MGKSAKGFLIITAAVLLALGICALLPNIGSGAEAAAELTCVQSDTVLYNGYKLIDDGKFVDFARRGETEFVNPLYSALKFYWDGAEIPIAPKDVVFDNKYAVVKVPGQYELAAKVEYGGVKRSFSVKFKISKAPLTARTLINGKREAEILEGDAYEATVAYEGFVGGDTVRNLDSPAIIAELPKMATDTRGFLLVPQGALSSLYDISYAGARIVIKSNPQSEIQFKENDEVLLTLSGSFSPCYELEFVNTGINVANVDYAAMNEKVDRYYGNSGIFEEYKQYGAFKIGLKLDGEDVNLVDPITVRVKVDEALNGKRNLRVLHFAPDGTYETLTATARDGVLIFNSVELGEYVLIVPIEGASISKIVGITIGVVAVVVLIALFLTVFRRKY